MIGTFAGINEPISTLPLVRSIRTDFKKPIIEGLSMYPYFYDENLKPIKLEDAFNPNAFNSIVASFTEIK